MWILPLLIAAAALPVFFIYLWFRLSRFLVPLPWFFCSLLGGAAALFTALLLQSFIPENIGALIPRMFIRVAFTEELSRLPALFFLLRIFRRLKWDRSALFNPEGAPGSCDRGVYGALTGLVTGLGFALLESASYGAADLNIALLRALSSAPLHGACGSRVGSAAATFRDQPAAGFIRFVSAAAIHGMYNLLLILPGIPSVLAILAALFTLISSLLFIRGGLRSGQKHPLSG
jgi:RsiW-degrading membrane proteinase PrsW (M82 family)